MAWVHLAAMQQGSSDRYFQDEEAGAEKFVPEGIEGECPIKVRLGNYYCNNLLGGLRSSMGYVRMCKNIEDNAY